MKTNMDKVMKNNVSFAGNTDLGMVRTNNEDSFLVQKIWDNDHILAVVIDGVGGYEGGEVAAGIARNSILDYLCENREGEKSELLKRAVVYANNRIYEERMLNPQLANMSCVLTASLIDAAKGFVSMAHVGDTRLYQYCDGNLTKLSHDHSLVGYREEIGDLTEEEAMRHPQRNIISRDVGSRMLLETEEEYVEVESYPLLSGSVLMLCSDGLCDMITSATMAAVLATDVPADVKVDELISRANNAGGRDNVTVVVVEIAKVADEANDNPIVEEIVNISEIQPDVIEVYSSKNDIVRKSFFSKYKVELIGALVAVLLFTAFALHYLYMSRKAQSDSAVVEIVVAEDVDAEPSEEPQVDDMEIQGTAEGDEDVAGTPVVPDSDEPVEQEGEQQQL